MSVMELAEVVNPHFAVPVVGVVLCAFLVFAFGFKSSVQPPSFDFENKQRSRPKPSKKAKKTPTNGHVVAVEAGVNQAPKPASPKAVATPKSAHGEKNENVQKSKPKKNATTPKPSKEEMKTTVKIAKEEQDDGEWLTAKTRKRKSKKDDAKREDGSDSSPETNKIESTPEPETQTEVKSTQDLVEEAVVPAPETALEKRAPRKERKKKESAEKTTAIQEPTPSKKNEEAVAKTELVEKMAQKEAAVVAEQEETKASPKKNKKKKSKAATPEVSAPKDDGNVQGNVKVEPAAEHKVDDKNEEKDPIQIALEDAAADDDTLTPKEEVSIAAIDAAAQDPAPVLKSEVKSPKKKKKSKDSREKYPENIPKLVTEKSEIEDSVPLAQSSIETKVENKKSQRDGEDKNTETIASESPSSSETAPSPTNSTPVTFDELGEWQEAKPVKRKKKARRDN